MLSGRGSTGSRPFRYHASWGTWLGEEARDGTHGGNRCCGSRGGITRTAASVELDSLCEAELLRVRDYERRNKNRETLLEQIERCACRVHVHVQRQPL